MKKYLMIGLILLAGCAGAKKQIESQPIEAQAVATPNAKEVAPVQERTVPTTEHYIVIPKDSLWKIAGKVYQDAFQWPALFKANRDQIQDPDLIYPKQVLAVDRGQDSARCRALALKTPKYHRHTKPRNVLPVNYF